MRKIYNNKIGAFRAEIITLCEEMNIDLDCLKPRTPDEFLKEVAKTEKKKNLSNQAIANIKYNYFTKRRYQALSILKIRYEDMRNEIIYPQKASTNKFGEELYVK